MASAKPLDLETLANLRRETGDGTPGDTVDPRSLSTTDLTRYIVARHHEVARKVLPSILTRAIEVARVHGHRRPTLENLVETIDELAGILIPHFVVEERIVFPALSAQIPDRPVIARELASMAGEHVILGRLLHRMRTEALDYEVPTWGDASYQALCGDLQALEENIATHMHLENRVLMPRFAH